MAKGKADELLAALGGDEDDILRPLSRESGMRGDLMRNALREMRRNMGPELEARAMGDEAIMNLRSRIKMNLAEEELASIAPPPPISQVEKFKSLSEHVRPRPSSILEAPLLRPSLPEEDAGEEIVADDMGEGADDIQPAAEAVPQQPADDIEDEAYAGDWAHAAATEPLPHEVDHVYRHLAQPADPYAGQHYGQQPGFEAAAYAQPHGYPQGAFAAPQQPGYVSDYASPTAFLPPPHSYGDPSPPPLMSPQAAGSAETAFRQLSDTILARATGDRSLEDITREMLRGMLRQWLDEHLPGLVEDLVREEIQRVARRGR